MAPQALICEHLESFVGSKPVSLSSWESRFPGALGLALPFKHLYTLQIREMFAKDGMLGPINLFDWKRVVLVIKYLCGACPFLHSPPWFRDSLARFWYIVADHIDEFVVRPAQRAAVCKNVKFFLQKLQLPGLSVPLLIHPGEMKVLRRNGWVLSAVRTALQSMRCRPARAWEVSGPMSSMQRRCCGSVRHEVHVAG